MQPPQRLGPKLVIPKSKWVFVRKKKIPMVKGRDHDRSRIIVSRKTNLSASGSRTVSRPGHGSRRHE